MLINPNNYIKKNLIATCLRVIRKHVVKETVTTSPTRSRCCVRPTAKTSHPHIQGSTLTLSSLPADRHVPPSVVRTRTAYARASC